jgi:hypothetical protein
MEIYTSSMPIVSSIQAKISVRPVAAIDAGSTYFKPNVDQIKRIDSWLNLITWRGAWTIRISSTT